MKKYVIDRFEESFAVLQREDGSTKDVEKALLNGAQEGDVVVFENGVYMINEDETAKRKALISEKLERLLGKK